MRKLAIVAFVFAAPLPWRLRRFVLRALCGYAIHPTAFISRFALVLPSRLEMGPGAKIGTLTVCKGLRSASPRRMRPDRAVQLDYRVSHRNR